MSAEAARSRPRSAVPGVPVLRAGLFRGKLQVPAPCQLLVGRDRLYRVIDDALEHGSLIVSAPAGSGKTQLMVGWTSHQPTPRAVAWLTLDPGDREPLRFLRYLVATVAATEPGHDAMGTVALPIAASTASEALLLNVAEAMARLTGEVVLVLDDFDAIVGSDTEQLLARVLRYPPDTVRLVVLSRREPILGQARLGLLGYVTELGEGDLAFTRQEFAALFERQGLPLQPRRLDELWTRTAGWAAGSALTALALAHQAAEAARTVDTTALDVDAGEALAAEYLMTEVFAVQPATRQEFLRRATTANPICGELADALTESTEGSATLAELHAARLFLARLDDAAPSGSVWYRWHPLFARAVQQTVAASEPRLSTTLHRTAARWHRRHGSPVEAVRHAMAGQDPDWAAELLGECWLDLVVAGESTVLRSLFELFDERARSTHAELAVVCAFLRLQRRDLDRACRCAEEAIGLSRRLPTRRQVAVEVMATVVRLRAAVLTGLERVDGLHGSATDLVERIRRTRGYLASRERVHLALLLHQLGAYENSRWLVDEARGHLTQALAEAEAEGLPDLAQRCTAQLSLTELTAGRLGSAGSLALSLVGPAQCRPWCSPNAAATAHLALGGVELARGEVASALQHLSQASEVGQPEDLMTRARIGALNHLALQAAGRVAQARDELDRLKAQLLGREVPPWVRSVLGLLEAEQLVAEERWADALAVLETQGGPPGTDAEVIRRCWHAEALRLSGRPEQASAELAELLVTGAPRVVAPLALVSQAVASQEIGHDAEALHSLERALAAAEPEQELQPFLRLGPQVRPLLERLVDSGTRHEAFALALLRRLDDGGRRAAMPPLAFEPLTAREREILCAMQGTASNEEIAHRMFVSLNTLRTHLKHINRKLGTSSRREAVARARELSLL